MDENKIETETVAMLSPAQGARIIALKFAREITEGKTAFGQASAKAKPLLKVAEWILAADDVETALGEPVFATLEAYGEETSEETAADMIFNLVGWAMAGTLSEKGAEKIIVRLFDEGLVDTRTELGAILIDYTGGVFTREEATVQMVNWYRGYMTGAEA